MSTPSPSRLFRLGRHAARHARAYVVVWVVLVIAGFATSLGAFGPGLFDRLETGDAVAPGQATAVRDLVAATDDSALPVILRVDGADLADPELGEAVTEFVGELRQVTGIGAVTSPMTTQGWPTNPLSLALVADHDPSSGTFLVTADAGSVIGSDLQHDVVDAMRTHAEALLDDHVDEWVVGGTGLLVDDIVGQVKQDLVVGESIALPLSLLLMLVVFGGFVAAGMPIAGAIASISGALGLLLGFSYVVDLDVTVVNIVTVMGLALCIDYGLLLVSRFREELPHVAPGVAPADLTDAHVAEAVGAAVATAGRTVAFSAVIVAISLSGLMIFDAPIMRAIGAAGVSVVVVALVVALTLVPALCALGARRLGRRRGAEAAPDDGVFSRLARRVQRRPAITALLSVVVLLVLAAPALDLRLTSSSVELLPPGAEQREFFLGIEDDFPALATASVSVVAQTDLATARTWAAEFAERDDVTRVDPPRPMGPAPDDLAIDGLDPDGADLVIIGLHTAGSLTDDDARTVAADLRDVDMDFPTWTGGQAAALADFTDAMVERAPWAALWIAVATFVLLFLLTGSVVIPVKALLLNVVSLGASIGILVWIFQEGHLEWLFRFESVGAIESMIPLMVLAFGFGLSMDYEVFLLARIIELHEEGHDDDTAVRLGLQRSGRIITSAAAIMVIVFAGFAAGEMLVIKQTGVALATAVLIDATLVRMVVVPATMTMLGRWNWWAPRWLKPVHDRFGVREHGSPVSAQLPPRGLQPPGV